MSLSLLTGYKNKGGNLSSHYNDQVSKIANMIKELDDYSVLCRDANKYIREGGHADAAKILGLTRLASEYEGAKEKRNNFTQLLVNKYLI